MRKLFGLACLFLSNIVYANLPYAPLNFPRDEAAHYDNIPYSFNELMEWWYFNGKATTDDGKNLSYDIALFNPAKRIKNTTTQAMLHIQIADLDSKISYGTAKNYLPNTGKIATDHLSITIDDDYSLEKKIVNDKEVYILKAKGHNKNTLLKLDLILEPTASIFLINENGLMPMPNETNSYYYSIPHFKTTGTLTINHTVYQINKQAGDSWMDHQWGDFHVEENGWEWFSVRLDNGLIGNIFLNIDYKNNSVIGGLANIVLPTGEKKFISYKDFIVSRDNYWFDKKLQISYPMSFTLTFPSLNLVINNIAAFPEQEIHGYWEGYCNISAVYQKQDVAGFSYTEIVYQNPDETNF